MPRTTEPTRPLSPSSTADTRSGELRPPTADSRTGAVTLAALGHGGIARIESVGGGSLAPLLDRLGLRTGTVVRCQTSASSTIVLQVGSRLVPIPRAWAHAVRVSAFEPAHPGDRAATAPARALSREERSFAADASSRMHG
ncbi:MAG TPA: FeoA family protein [Gemmatimonadaceae bacterium]|nr:FeoA family protein [Gemmatimonadaceae bacterium]